MTHMRQLRVHREDAADDALALAQQADRDRALVDGIYSRLLAWEGQADASDAVNHAQQLVESLRWLAIQEQARAPDLDNTYRSGQRPGSF